MALTWFITYSLIQSVFIPTDPLFPNDPFRVVVPSFLLVVGSDRALPPNPVKSFGLQFDLVFSAAGVLDFNASTVHIVELPDDIGEE